MWDMLTLLCFLECCIINGVNCELSFPTCDARLHCRLLLLCAYVTTMLLRPS
jgi:hypothetical protein